MKALIQGLATSTPMIKLTPETEVEKEEIEKLGVKLFQTHSVRHGGFKYLEESITISLTPVGGTKD